MRRQREPVVFRRAVQVERIPDGGRFELDAGTLGEITQALGSSFTIHVDGRLVRLKGTDADAIGKPVPQAPDTAEGEPGDLEARIWRTMKTCYDPEIPIDIVELGLVYESRLEPAEAGNPAGPRRAVIRMTLTAPGCGMGDVLVNDVKTKVMQIPNIAEADVELTFDPPWSRDMMSEAALLDAQALGLNLNVFISISLKEQAKESLAEFERRIAEHDEVMECYLMTGDSDYLIRVVVTDIAALERFILEQLTPIPGIEKIRSSFALKQVRSKTALPLVGRSVKH
mgnify:CR=1 FL=1